MVGKNTYDDIIRQAIGMQPEQVADQPTRPNSLPNIMTPDEYDQYLETYVKPDMADAYRGSGKRIAPKPPKIGDM